MALTITYVKCPEEKYSIKCPYTMIPTRIVVHNTYNDASAMNEISYMLRNEYTTSFHYAVDYERAVQGLPLNRNSWNAGDGTNGKGNRYGISIEICYSKNGGERFTKSEENGAELVAMLLKQYGWGIDKVTKHQDYSGKYCPHRTLDLGWERFLNLVREKLGESPKPQPTPKPSGLKHKEGEIVKINGIYTSSTSENMLNPAISQGTITKVFVGTRNPYLLNDSDGFVNDDCIVENTQTPTPTPTPKPKKKTLYLPKTVNSWNVYPLNKAPVIGNECGKLKPSLFGGLEYEVLAEPQADVVTIQTRDFGKVNIYVGKDTPAVIK